MMGGWVYAMKPADYARWLSSGAPGPSLVSEGENLFEQYGCTGCHGPASTVHAPSLVGIYNKPVPLQDGQFAKADDKYLHDSIVLPGTQIAAGYANAMPSYHGRLSEDQILALITYIRSLGDQPMDSLRPPIPVNPATENGRGTGAMAQPERAAHQAAAGAAPAVTGTSVQTLRPAQNTELHDRQDEAKRKKGNE